MPRLKIVNSKMEFEINSHAKDAFLFLENYPFLLDHSKLTSQLKEELAKEILIATERKDKQCNIVFQIVAPLTSALFWENDKPPAGTYILIDNSLTDKEIEKKAWASINKLFVWSFDQSKCCFFRDAFSKYMPSYLHQYFFSNKKVSDSQISELTGYTRGALIQQRKNQDAQPDSNLSESFGEYVNKKRSKNNNE